ncbi:MAG: CDP-archaeol synthase [Clostridiales bacterium]|nr:CDP-archaeol synthase [Clostridiales bacterium]
MSASMRNRIIIGMILIGIVALTVVVGGYFMNAVALLSMAGTLFEMYRAIKHVAPTIRLWPMLLFVVINAAAAWQWGLTGVVGAFVACVMLIFAQKILAGELDFTGIMYSVFVLIYPGLFGAMLFHLTLLPDPLGRMGMLMAVFYASAPDMFAYFVGMTFGKHKMAPIISPKKSWEGEAGALLGGLVTGVAMYFLQGAYGIAIPIWHHLVLGLVCSVCGTIGDLAASLIKRSVGIKDYSRLLLDHGGLMDRFDSVLFVAPVICVYFLVFI